MAEEHPGLTIRFLGLWDTVGQFGLPGEQLQAGHDLSCPRNVRRCYHALSLDENRALFPLTRMLRDDAPVDGFVEAWFRGVHSDVGGGNGNRGLNWISLHWMLHAAKREGLPILQAEIERNYADRVRPAEVRLHHVAADVRRRIYSTDLVHASVQPIPGQPAGREAVLARIDDEGVVRQVA